MYVESLSLDNFRNYERMHMELDPGVNLLYGDNAQGKTNALEAVYLCSTTKSHRGGKDKEMVRFGSEDAHLRMIIVREGIHHKIDMHLKRSKAKGIAIDGIPIKRSSELFGLIHVICFSPEDLAMIKNGPGERRHFLDMSLCQLSTVYLHDIAGYNKVVNQRNNLLKQISVCPELKDTLDIWDMQLVSYGRRVIRARRELIGQISELMGPIHLRLTGGKENLKLCYQPNVSEDDFEVQLFMKREQDIRSRISQVGPHRDDFIFEVDGVDIRHFGSQGQQRSAALSLKLAEIELVRQTIHDTPVLLLDDVLSELDSSRQNHLLDSMGDIQTIVTCTGLDEFVSGRVKMDRLFHVESGNITLMEDTDLSFKKS